MQNLTVTQEDPRTFNRETWEVPAILFRASWDEPGFSFDILLNADGMVLGDYLVKAAPRSMSYSDPAWFDLKRLKASSKGNARIVAKVLAAIKDGDLINRAIADTAARRKAALELAKADPVEGYRARLRAAADAVMKADREAGLSLEFLSRSLSREALAAFGAALQASIE